MPKEKCRRFEGKAALVTAGAKGLGREVASRLAHEGARVVIWDNDAEALDSCRAETDPERLHWIATDLLDAGAIEAAFKETRAAFGPLDILVNNAGGSLHTPQAFLEESEEDWARVMGLNLDAARRTARLVLPGMMERGYGRIVNMGSKAGRFGSFFAGANYAASKGAVQALTLQWAQEYGRHGITCNAVCPGAILTERVDRLLSERKTPEERKEMLAGIPVGRHGRVEDVAAAVCFLAAEEAGFVTGVMLDVNGGQAMVA
ncbi:short-chain dehydrogenase [Afifella sp. IM 167]|nr:short-chain dehydrogenase [Afifella sp. IM 167]